MTQLSKAEPREMAGSIPVFCTFDEITPLERIIPNPKNPNTHPEEQIQLLSKIISSQGWRMPIVVSTRSGFIVKGHGRLKAAQRAGMEFAPVEYQNYATEADEYSDLIADNRIAELSIMDEDILSELMAELEAMDEDFDFELTGYTDDELEEIIGTLEEENQEIVEDDFELDELPEEPQAQIGDIYQLGRHRLICGDCTDRAVIDTLLNGEKAIAVVTDPPYNMAYEGAGNTSKEKRKKNRILNDKMSDEDFTVFLTSVYDSIHYSLVDGGSFYIFYKELGTGTFITSLKYANLTYKQDLIWVKNQLVLGGSKYQSMYEPCIFGSKGKSVEHWYTGRKERSVIEQIDLMTEDELKDTIKELLSEQNPDIIRVDKNKVNDLHPTMKPIKLLAYLINNSTQKGDIVVDLFGGSGSTLIACEQTGRTCYTSELDRKYVDVIIRRYEEFTGEKAVLLNAAETNRDDKEAEEVQEASYTPTVSNH